MPKYIDYHEKLTPLPQLPPARVKELMNDIKAAKVDQFGVRYFNFFSAKNGHGFCITDAPSVDALLESPGVRLGPLGPEWARLRQLCLDKKLGGNDLPDAWLSAAVAHVGEHLVSFDRDFRKLLSRGQFTLLQPE